MLGMYTPVLCSLEFNHEDVTTCVAEEHQVRIISELEGGHTVYTCSHAVTASVV